jgi:hypothetical protein
MIHALAELVSLAAFTGTLLYVAAFLTGGV